ncbi:Myb-like_DNA-binding domain-containing protein [Hexamita inflata]|uniref:Myb-like DNA-binding domain-containing protein n=1 Tax=Hexamita inflata TaxID=28002 RepID=A0AA86PWZ4_9EUKA|nr:Myb-like DNA-binding domain-containing protein [Hexamita inflata]
MQRTHWSKSDKKKLVDAVYAHTKNNRTSWAAVSKLLNRTKNQCRKQYTYLSKSNPIQKNVRWSGRQFGQLFGSVLIHGQKWELIRKLQFPNFTAEQLRKKYALFQKRRQQGEFLIKMIMSDKIISKDLIPHMVKFYEHFKNLLFMYNNYDKMDIIARQAVTKVYEELNLSVLVEKMQKILIANGMEI